MFLLVWLEVGKGPDHLGCWAAELALLEHAATGGDKSATCNLAISWTGRLQPMLPLDTYRIGDMTLESIKGDLGAVRHHGPPWWMCFGILRAFIVKPFP